jgi:hypothetical protein
VEQELFELVAEIHSELAKRLAQVAVDGAGADEQLRGDVLVAGTVDDFIPQEAQISRLAADWR